MSVEELWLPAIFIVLLVIASLLWEVCKSLWKLVDHFDDVEGRTP